jgi:hypothetical protein
LTYPENPINVLDQKDHVMRQDDQVLQSSMESPY